MSLSGDESASEASRGTRPRGTKGIRDMNIHELAQHLGIGFVSMLTKLDPGLAAPPLAG